jgi:hypothetical protein
MTDLDERTYEKSLRLPTYDGTDDQFQIFWMRVKAYAKVYNFAPALKIGVQTDLPATYSTSIDITTTAGMRQAAEKINEIAIANFTMAFTSDCTVSWV